MRFVTVRVLVVDDQEPFRRAATAVVNALDGFEVVGVAQTGEDSVACVPELRPDMILMDVNLPGMTGLEATRRIRQLRPSTIVVLLSTYDRAEYGQEVDDCGAAEFVGKSAFDGNAVRRAWSGVGAGRHTDREDGLTGGSADGRSST